MKTRKTRQIEYTESHLKMARGSAFLNNYPEVSDVQCLQFLDWLYSDEATKRFDIKWAEIMNESKRIDEDAGAQSLE